MKHIFTKTLLVAVLAIWGSLSAMAKWTHKYYIEDEDGTKHFVREYVIENTDILAIDFSQKGDIVEGNLEGYKGKFYQIDIVGGGATNNITMYKVVEVTQIINGEFVYKYGDEGSETKSVTLYPEKVSYTVENGGLVNIYNCTTYHPYYYYYNSVWYKNADKTYSTITYDDKDVKKYISSSKNCGGVNFNSVDENLFNVYEGEDASHIRGIHRVFDNEDDLENRKVISTNYENGEENTHYVTHVDKECSYGKYVTIYNDLSDYVIELPKGSFQIEFAKFSGSSLQIKLDDEVLAEYTKDTSGKVSFTMPASGTLVLHSTGNTSFDYVAIYSDLVPVKVGSTGFATFASTKALDFSDCDNGVVAYQALQNGDQCYFDKVTKVPANTGILLYSNIAKTGGKEVVAYASPISEGFTDVSKNLLVGVTTNNIRLATNSYYEDNIVHATSGYTNYLLYDKYQNENGEYVDGVNFYYAPSSPVKVRINSAYLKFPNGTSNAAKMFLINLDEDGSTTGISDIATKANAADGAIYNLAGQKVGSDYKGIVIKNGKKYLNK